MIDKEAVSIVMPIHGNAPWLDQTLESVFSQEGIDYEFVIIKDRVSRAIDIKLNSLKNERDSLTVLESNSPGISHALNLGISASRFNLIARVDSDDVMLPNRLLIQANSFLKNSDLVVLGSQMEIIDENSRLIGRTNYPTQHNEIKKYLRYRNPLAHPSTMFRKDTFTQSGGYRDFASGVEDYDLWLRMIELGVFKNLPFPLTRYRRSDGQVTKRNEGKQIFMDSIIRIHNYYRFDEIWDKDRECETKCDSLEYIPLRNIEKMHEDLMRKLSCLDFRYSSQIRSAFHLNMAIFFFQRTLIRDRLKTAWHLLISSVASPKLVLDFARQTYLVNYHE